MNKPSYTITDNAIVLFFDGRNYTVNRSQTAFADVKNALRTGDYDSIPGLLDLKGRLISESAGGLYLLNGTLHCQDHEVPASLATRIITMFKEGFDVSPLTSFFENLTQNPDESGTIKDQLYRFIERCNLPITPDGHFLAYKMVNKDFTDIFTGRMDNSVGAVVEMDRSKCDTDPNRVCSTGLHFCSEGYLGKYGTRQSSQLVVVKINPRDVTSIPTDYNHAKGRACRYEIVDAISWDEIITPYFSDEYTESEDASDEVSETTVSNRWEVRSLEDGSLVESFASRQDAREFYYASLDTGKVEGLSDYFVWDNKTHTVVVNAANVDDSILEVAQRGEPVSSPDAEPEVMSDDDFDEIVNGRDGRWVLVEMDDEAHNVYDSLRGNGYPQAFRSREDAREHRRNSPLDLSLWDAHNWEFTT